ncbi:hypothetical protein K435DRAFT_869329 [Dendrothele bispora CBS 962.96]|uniref:Uncharacterized protein n=1 Tax=Dendrothele bispora (strain CBS 962.96) TaxID=1314807 RepID=A0A4S8L9G7_DENBC|nr:hypothetical protein K435DRAFT_869329 [Dendrothele bispora CBS 962.96]
MEHSDGSLPYGTAGNLFLLQTTSTSLKLFSSAAPPTSAEDSTTDLPLLQDPDPSSRSSSSLSSAPSLTSPTPAISGSKRKRRTRRKRKNPSREALPETAENEPSTSSKKSTERSHKSRQRYRQMKKQEGPTAYKTRIPSAYQSISKAKSVGSSLQNDNFLDRTSGYTCKPQQVDQDANDAKKTWELEELCGPDSLGFELIRVTDRKGLVPIVDCNNRVFCVASPPPSNEDWKDVNAEAASALERERDGSPQHQGLKLNEVHRRGRFGALSTGFSANGGITATDLLFLGQKT